MEDILLSRIAQAQPKWFSVENMRFFNDLKYWAMKSASGKIFLVRETYAWTDMFDRPPRLHFRVNEVNATTLKIGGLVEQEFKTMDDVAEWLEGR